MKNLLIILSFAAMIGGAVISCKETEVIQTQEVKLYYVKSNVVQRYIDGQWVDVGGYLYRTEDGNITYSFEHFKGWFFTYDQKR